MTADSLFIHFTVVHLIYKGVGEKQSKTSSALFSVQKVFRFVVESF